MIKQMSFEGLERTKDLENATVIHQGITELTSEWWLQRLYEFGKILYERCEEREV